MAYVSKETKKELAPAIKAVLAEFGVKGTIKVSPSQHSVCHSSESSCWTSSIRKNLLVVVVMLMFYHIDTFYEGTAKKFLTQVARCHERVQSGMTIVMP